MTLQDPGRPLAPSAAPASSLPVVRLVADLACPWCYVGLHRLLTLAPREPPFRLAWHPFLLNPHLPAGGVPRPLYLERKFGGAAQADAVYRRAAATAAAQGLELRLDRIRVQPDTRLAHAALLDAGARLPELVSALFAAFFRDGSDLGDPEVLAALGRRLGFDVPEPAAAAARVGAMHEAACRAGIDGVPVFVFGEDHVSAGAQPSECLAALLRLERYRVSGASGAAAQGRQAS